MRFMVMMYPGEEAEKGILPDEKALAEMGRFNEDLVKAGVLLAGEGLHPSSTGVRVVFGTGKPAVKDGPFTEAKEAIGGFWLWEVKSREEAVEWVKRCPAQPGQQMEIRKVYEAEDFGAALTPELREAEEKLRKQVETKKPVA
jgi:hypothetical protein